MDEWTAENARVKLGEVLGAVRYGKEPVAITRRGKRVALVVPAEWESRLPGSDWYARAVAAIGEPEPPVES